LDDYSDVQAGASAAQSFELGIDGFPRAPCRVGVDSTRARPLGLVVDQQPWIRCAQDSGLGRFPARVFAVNAAWFETRFDRADLIGWAARRPWRIELPTALDRGVSLMTDGCGPGQVQVPVVGVAVPIHVNPAEAGERRICSRHMCVFRDDIGLSGQVWTSASLILALNLKATGSSVRRFPAQPKLLPMRRWSPWAR
jgi:hypothetical protein